LWLMAAVIPESRVSGDAQIQCKPNRRQANPRCQWQMSEVEQSLK